MELSNYAINALIPLVTGDSELTNYKKGSELTKFFNTYGFRDVYDFNKGGLPKLSDNKMNTSRTEYTKDRLSKLSGKPELQTLLEDLVNSSDKAEKLAKEINEIISPDKFNIEKINNKYIILGSRIIKKQEPKNDARFKDIQNSIIKELENAQVSISLAMAWFTNKTLLEKLKEKQEQGVKVEIVIFDDGINAKYGVDLQGFDFVKVRAERGGKMHHKFCVIDNQTVITGSYNWSDNAEYKNDENISIQADPQQATKYSVEFRNLRTQTKK
ncbi:phospholipase D-like domain-containing protein [Parabacteroides goldsteinii]|uniref:phospholipase D-like domain-containing protein n=1 Tax=Parabacteroides goldsteinii TaxID=328812 RepID=UPI00189F776F|nr:phospholipase D-like domain-containing protein [Parabacteroides goldsteinii]